MRGPLCATQALHNGITYCSIRVGRKAVYGNILLGGLLWADVQSRLLGLTASRQEIVFCFFLKKQEIVFKKKNYSGLHKTFTFLLQFQPSVIFIKLTKSETKRGSTYHGRKYSTQHYCLTVLYNFIIECSLSILFAP